MLEELLKQKKCMKLICGAGNQDISSIEKLVAVYAKAGCRFFDISADNAVISAVKEILDKFSTNEKKFICVSVGTKNDAHFQKAKIDKTKCLNCFKCVSNCPQKAIDTSLNVDEEKCIGCGRCEISCPSNCIFFEEKRKKLKKLFYELNLKNVDCIELHIGDEEDCFENWNILRRCFSGMLSICIGRKKFSDEKFIGILEKLLRDQKPYSVMIQADGSPMSGGVDDYKSTLQAVASGNLVQQAHLQQYLLISGGTNSKSSKLAKLCSVDINGVSIGSYARKIIAQYIERKDFWHNQEVFDEAVKVAKKFINENFE